MKKFIISAVVLILLAGAAGYKLMKNKEKNQSETAIVSQKNTEVYVKSSKVAKEMLSGDFSSNGTFVAEQDLNVSAEIGGQVEKIFVKEGDVVKAGQVLAKIKGDKTNVMLDNAKAMLDNAKNEVRRFESAYATGGVTEQQLAQIRLQLKNAQANYNNASLTSGDTNVRSKISGIVSSKMVEEGMIVGAGTPLFNVVDINVLKLKVSVDESQVLKIKKGDAVMVKPSIAEKEVKGVVSFVSPKSSGGLKFPVEVLVNNKEGGLKSGMYATANFSSSEKGGKVEVVVVPRDAFVGSVSQGQIFKIVDGKAQMTNVKSGRIYGDKVEIVEGLNAGDEVVTSGQINLDNGTLVKVVQ